MSTARILLLWVISVGVILIKTRDKKAIEARCKDCSTLLV
jgi:hypothetical protein